MALIDKIIAAGMKAGVAIKPKTPIDALVPLLESGKVGEPHHITPTPTPTTHTTRADTVTPFTGTHSPGDDCRTRFWWPILHGRHDA